MNQGDENKEMPTVAYAIRASCKILFTLMRLNVVAGLCCAAAMMERYCFEVGAGGGCKTSVAKEEFIK